jgi:hypothetical protein
MLDKNLILCNNMVITDSVITQYFELHTKLQVNYTQPSKTHTYLLPARFQNTVFLY